MSARVRGTGRLQRLLRFGRTVSHLRASQLLWRLRYALERRLPARRPASSGTPGGSPVAIDTSALAAAVEAMPWLQGSLSTAVENLRLLHGGTFRILHRDVPLGCPPGDWRLGNPESERLWIMTLHTQPWAYEAACVCGDTECVEPADRRSAAGVFRVLIDDWIERCDLARPGSRPLAWNSYTIATRLRWWVAAFATGRDGLFDDAGFTDRFLESVWRQALFLDAHVEWDLRANHLLRNAEGLAWAGALFDHPAAARWRRRAGTIACSQIAEQVLADGGHFECSGRYHLEVMQDLAAIAILSQDPVVRERLAGSWSRMAEFLVRACHPDGTTHQFNDSSQEASLDDAHIPHTAELLGVAPDTSAPEGARLLADTGLVTWHGPRWTVFFDVGAIGPACQPGHAHADSLAVECSLNGERLFVDAGTFAYDLDERRAYDRSTAAHNTVCVDGTDSSEVWHIFRVGRRAEATVLDFESSRNGMEVRAAHDGYRHLPGAPRHERTVQVHEDGELLLRDEVHGRGRHRVSAGLLVAPSWKVENTSEGWMLHHAGSGRRASVRIDSSVPVDRQLRQTPYHPCLGVELQVPRIEWSWEGRLPLRVTVSVDPDAR
jgi:hypothetical protein